MNNPQRITIYYNSGFTIIEILVALLIFGILMTVLVTTMTGSMKLNTQSQKQINTAANVQQLLETVRASWLVSPTTAKPTTNYDDACFVLDNYTLLPTGYTVSFINLSSRAKPVDKDNNELASAPTPTKITPTYTSNAAAACTASSNARLSTPSGAVPVMRRLIVSSGTGAQDTILSVDVLRPK